MTPYSSIVKALTSLEFSETRNKRLSPKNRTNSVFDEAFKVTSIGHCKKELMCFTNTHETLGCDWTKHLYWVKTCPMLFYTIILYTDICFILFIPLAGIQEFPIQKVVFLLKLNKLRWLPVGHPRITQFHSSTVAQVCGTSIMATCASHLLYDLICQLIQQDLLAILNLRCELGPDCSTTAWPPYTRVERSKRR